MRALANGAGLLAAAFLFGLGCGESRSPEERRVETLCEQLRDHDVNKRLDAAKELARLKPKAAAEPLIRSLYDIRTDVRLAAIEALGEIADPAATEPLLGVLKEENWTLRKAVAEALGKIADPKAIPKLIETLADEDRSVALAAATTLGKLGPPALEPLIQSCPPEPPVSGISAPTAEETREAERLARVREGIAYAIGYIGDASNPRAAKLLRILLADTVPSVRLAAADALSRLRDAQAIPPIAALLKDPDETVRRGVRHALARLGPAALPALEAAVKDARRDVRLAAIAALGDIADPRSTVPLLIGAADTDRDVSAAAEKSLRGRLGGKQAPTPLVEALKHPDAAVRLEAMELLSDLAFPRGAVKPACDLSGAVEPLLAALRDAEPKMRVRAATLLGRLGDERAVELLSALLDDPEPAVGLAAAQALAAGANPQAVDALLAVLKDSSAKLSAPKPRGKTERELAAAYESAIGRLCVAIEALGKSRDKRAADPLLALLTHSDVKVRELAVKALAEVADPRAFDRIVPLMEPTTEKLGWHERYIREAAIRAAARLGGKQALKPILAQLNRPKQLPELIPGICRALGEIGGPDVVEPLVNVLLTADWKEHRAAAAMALAKLGAEAVGPLIARLKGADRATRGVLALVLSRLGEPAAEPLLAALKNDDAATRHGAAWALAQLGDKRAAEPLLGLLNDPDPSVRGGAAWALGELHEPRALDPLIALLGDSVAEARWGAAEALGKLGSDRAVDPLLALLGDAEPVVRRAAILALGGIGSPRAVEPLRRVELDKDASVAAAAKEALQSIRASAPVQQPGR
ncbi:MAG: HEAT repeat domain-containing protein [Planctomycetes bacterium]|nr:HEAT repeat domain-containing protein [Planctomycetota bacterium]